MNDLSMEVGSQPSNVELNCVPDRSLPLNGSLTHDFSHLAKAASVSPSSTPLSINDIDSDIRNIMTLPSSYRASYELSAFNHAMKTQPTIKQKVRKFSVTLHKNDTLVHALTTKTCKCKKNSFYFFPTKLLIFLAILHFLLLILDYTINYRLFRSIEFNIIVKIPALLCIIFSALNCNYYIFKQSFHSFVVWYKTIFSLIAIICRAIYYDLFIYYWSDRKYNNFSQADTSASAEYISDLCVISFILSILCVGLGVFTLALLDGYATKGNTIKRVLMIIGILSCIMLYSDLYFNFYHKYNYDKEKKTHVHINGTNISIDLFWRDISLTSLFKAIVFFLAQFYFNFRYPDKLNVVPLPAIIEFVNATPPNGKNSTSGEVIPQNVNVLSKINNPIAKPNVANIQPINGNGAFHIGDIGNIRNLDNSGMSSISSIPDINNVSILQGEKIQSFEPSDDERDQPIARVSSKPFTISSAGHDVDSSTISTENNDLRKTSSTDIATYILNVPIQYTLLFVLLNKKHICNISRLQAFKWSKRMSNIKLQVFCAIVVLISVTLHTIIKNTNYDIINNDIVLLTIDCCMFLGFIPAMLNLNFKIVKYRIFKIVTLWKIFNVLSMRICISVLEYRCQRDTFDPEYYSATVSIVDAVVVGCAWCLAAFIVNLIRGYYINKWLKLLFIGLFISWHLKQAITHYVQVQYDSTVEFFGHTFIISLRTLIFVHGFDISIWYTAQFFQILKNPNRMNLVSKVRVKWIDNVHS